MQSNTDLVRDIEACDLPKGQLALWWLGQHGFVLKLGAAVVVIDAYLTDSERRNAPPLLTPGELSFAHLLLGSHDHGDHIDRGTWPAIATAVPDLIFGVPAPVRQRVITDLDLPDEHVIGLKADEPLERCGLTITPIPAAHEFLDRDPESGEYPYLGFIIEGHGCTVYHAGDTCLYEGIQRQVRPYAPDVMLLPINGRDAERLKRGCIGNMTYQEAADFAGSIQPVLTIPTHFEMFDGNTADPVAFTSYMAVKYPQLDAIIPVHGERIEVTAREPV